MASVKTRSGPVMEAETLIGNTLTSTDMPDRGEGAREQTPAFRSLGVTEQICEALEERDISRAFPIQSLTLPIALGGHDIIGQARTGTGKTLAFGIPLLQRLGPPETAPHALVIVPTRELALQVAGDLRAAGSRLDRGPHRGARVLTVYGGRAYEPQIETLRSGVDVVVGTPGRLLDLAGQRHLALSHVETLVLDEADKMLDLGFLPDIERILQLIPAERQTMLFSATMPGEVVALARQYLRQPMHVRAEHHDEPELVPSTEHHVFRVHHLDKIEVLSRMLQAKDRGLTMVFCQTKRTVDQVESALTQRGFATAAVHGDLGQSQRERALRAFRSGKVDVLVATDVAARGLDVDDVTHVVNYECPDDEKSYLHRIGRTGRAGRAGVAVTFADWRDLQRWKLIDTALGLGQPVPAEVYSTSQELYEQLCIPPSATGTLPRAMRGRAGLDAEAVEDIGETGRPRGAGRRGRGPVRGTGRPAARVRRRTRAGRPVHNGSAARTREAPARDAQGHDAPGRGAPAREAPVKGRGAAEAAARESAAAVRDAGRASGGDGGRTRRRRGRNRGNSAAQG
jgi:superfamily II DNA/RNA helicase